MNEFVSTCIRKSAVCAFSLIIPLSSFGAVVVESISGFQAITSATDVQVGNRLFDVYFEPSTSSEVDFQAQADLWTDSVEFGNAVNALLDEMNTVSAYVAGSIAAINNDVFMIELFGPPNQHHHLRATSTQDWFVNSSSSPNPGNVVTNWIETTPVPIPATAWLFGSALIGLAGISRKK